MPGGASLAASRLTHLNPRVPARREDGCEMKTHVPAPQSTGRIDDRRVANEHALRAERQLTQKMKAAAGSGKAAPSDDEKSRALALRAQANALLGKAIA